jgi:hypothetical protein
MGRHPAEQPIPDLFSTATVRDASPPRPKPSTPTAMPESAPQRHILPKNLRSAVKHLSDGELDLMHAATLEEMKRRGRLPPGVETDLRSLGHRLNVRPDLPLKRTSARNALTIGLRRFGAARWARQWRRDGKFGDGHRSEQPWP